MKRIKGQSRFHALLTPYTIHFDPPPPTLRKIDENTLKKSYVHHSGTITLPLKVW